MPESFETANPGCFGNRSAIFLENNSSLTSQLSLNLGIFRTGNRVGKGIFGIRELTKILCGTRAKKKIS